MDIEESLIDQFLLSYPHGDGETLDFDYLLPSLPLLPDPIFDIPSSPILPLEDTIDNPICPLDIDVVSTTTYPNFTAAQDCLLLPLPSDPVTTNEDSNPHSPSYQTKEALRKKRWRDSLPVERKEIIKKREREQKKMRFQKLSSRGRAEHRKKDRLRKARERNMESDKQKAKRLERERLRKASIRAKRKYGKSPSPSPNPYQYQSTPGLEKEDNVLEFAGIGIAMPTRGIDNIIPDKHVSDLNTDIIEEPTIWTPNLGCEFTEKLFADLNCFELDNKLGCL